MRRCGGARRLPVKGNGVETGGVGKVSHKGMSGIRAGSKGPRPRLKAARGALMNLGKMPHYNVNLLKSRELYWRPPRVCDKDIAC